MKSIKSAPELSQTSFSLFSAPDVALRLGVTEACIRRMVYERRIPFLKVGRCVRFSPEQIDRWLSERSVDPGGLPAA